MEKSLVKFLRKKDYNVIREIGQGGTGKTILLEDETIDEHFVCKKYSPFHEAHRELYYKNFVSEIKLLHLLYHRNVVRVFNYYLYPEHSTGYILMEFVNGQTVEDYLRQYPELINDIFEQTIKGFLHLEENSILHRDIRPSNILVSNDGIVKIIDLGFGKQTEFDGEQLNSVSLNWCYTIPEDFNFRTYDHQTEIYFVGKLFEQIINENNIQRFTYRSILSRMVQYKKSDRISSFFDIERKIIEGDAQGIEFSNLEKSIYQKFAKGLQSILTSIRNGSEYNRDVDSIIIRLDEVYRSSTLEDYVQNPTAVVRCFLRGEWNYNASAIVATSTLKSFIDFFKHSPLDKQKLIINNLWQRFDTIHRYDLPALDDLPF